MSGPQNDWSVVIHEDGRRGQVVYRESSGSLAFYWEFGGGNTVATIQVGDPETWQRQHGWAVGRRAEILRRVADEVIRQKAPSCRAEIDHPPGWISVQETGAPPAIPDTRQQFIRVAERKSKIVSIAAIVIFTGALALWGAKQLLSIRVPHGSPIGDSVRAGGEIATLIQTLEAYVPSLHRDPGKDRYSMSLFVWPVNGESKGRVIPLAEHLGAQESAWSELLGSDGRTVWFKLNGIGGIELATGKRIGPAELRAANSNLAESWNDPRCISFNQRLQLTLPDRKVLEIDPQTLKASPVQPPGKALPTPFRPEVGHFLCAGVRPSPAAWLGLHSLRETQRDFKVGSWLTRGNRQEEAKEMRRFYRGELGPELEHGNREIISMTPLSDQEFLNAAFVRAGSGEEPLRLFSPEGFLFIFTGKIPWQVDTGIDRFKLSQILPDARHVAFIGTRPPVPDKVSEPILVAIDTQSGAIFITTLWK